MRMRAIPLLAFALSIGMLGLALSGCEPIDKATKSVSKNVKNSDAAQWVKEQSSDMRSDLKRVIRPLLGPLFHYPDHVSLTAKSERANAPFIEPRLIKALALEEDMEDPIRPSMKGISRTYANNPRRGYAQLLPMYEGVFDDWAYASQPEWVKRWIRTHQTKKDFKQVLDALDPHAATLSQSQWLKVIDGMLPMTSRQVPLRVMIEAQQHPLARLHWRLQQTSFYHPPLLENIHPHDVLTRGEAMAWAIHVSGLDTELIKMQDDPYADEWWAPHHADPDARASLMRGWNHLEKEQQHYTIIAYAYGFMDKVFDHPPPDGSDDLKQWVLGVDEPISSMEALKALAWAEDYRRGFTM
jgi:hypothetical protein